MHWPAGVADRNKLRHEPWHAPKVAGWSIAPAFAKDGSAPHEHLYFNHNDNRALRTGDWKAILTGKGGAWELYDIKSDRSELNRLAATQPERLQR